VTELYFTELLAHARSFAALTPERERLLHELAPQVIPELNAVTDRFYAQLQAIPRTAPFLEGRLPKLRRTHRAWLESLFTQAYDVAFVEALYHVGDVHVKVRLPIEFIAGGMTLIQGELAPLALRLAAGDLARQAALVGAVNAALGFSLMVMQQSYQVSRLLAEHEKFLAITGITRAEFNKLATDRNS
jgi:protoglobin